MSLASLTLSLLPASPVQAQGPSGWQLDYYEADGSTKWTDGEGAHSEPWSASADGVGNRNGIYGNPCQSTGTVSAVFIWQGGGQPAAEIYLRITSHVNAAGTPSSTPSNNGFGDPGGTYDENGSAGVHLLHITNSSHNPTIKTSVYNLSAICGSQGYTTSVLFEAATDTSQTPRSVTITSSIDPTYRKDPSLGRVQNAPASDGTMTADTVLLNEGNSDGDISYIANPTGSWAADSSYHGYSALMGNSGAGTFTMPGDPPTNLDVFYSDANDGTIHKASQEHINLHCTDASDGANATANYYVNWHDEFEDWITIVDIRQIGLMTRVTPVYFVTHDDATFSYDLVNKVTVSQKATGEGSLGDDKIGAKFGVELGVDYESEVGNKLELGAYANQYNWLDRQAFWRHREGTVDNYDTHGYVGLLHWTLDSAYNPGNPLIDFVLFQRSSASPPSY